MTYPPKSSVTTAPGLVMVNLDEADRVDRVHETLKFLIERGCSERLFVRVLNMCPDPECDECGKLVCINGEPLHFHHDGCPGCDGTTNRFAQRLLDSQDANSWSEFDHDWHDLEPIRTKEEEHGSSSDTRGEGEDAREGDPPAV